MAGTANGSRGWKGSIASAALGIALGAATRFTPVGPASPAADGSAAPSAAPPTNNASASDGNVAGGAASAAPSPSPAPHTAGDRAEDVVDYQIAAALDAVAHTVHGEATIVWRNLSRVPVHELYLHLYLNAFKNEKTLFLRAPVASGRGTGAVDDFGRIDVHKLVARELGGVDLWPGADKTSPGDPDDQTDIRVPLPRDVGPGESLTLETSWDDKLPRIIERTGYVDSFHMVGQWFPKIAKLEPDGQFAHFAFSHLGEFYADFGRYDVTLDVPEGFIVGATGELTAEAHKAGRVVRRFVQDSVHDFAWTAWNRFVERSIDAGGVRIRYLYPPGYDAVAERGLRTAAWGLSSFAEAFGPYPYSALTIVHPPEVAREAGGMEYPTLITTGSPWWEPTAIHGLESVTLHELGHQYFYGVVATNEDKWPALDEGINSYAEGTALGSLFGPGSIVDLGNLGGITVDDLAAQRVFALSVVHDEPILQPASAFASGGDYGGLVYAGTATILGTMAGVYGRENVARALGRYTREHRFGHPEASDFLAIMRAELGDAAARNLRAALFDRGWVDYRISNAVSKPTTQPAGQFDAPWKSPAGDDPGKSPTGGAPWKSPTGDDGHRGSDPAAANGYEGWALVVRRGTLELPVDIELRAADGTLSRSTWDGVGSWTRVPYSGKSELVSARVDPDHRVLIDENLFNNGFCLTRPATAWRTLERTTFLGELLLAATMP